MKTKSVSKQKEWLTVCVDCWPKDEAGIKKLEGDNGIIAPVTMEGMDKNGCCAICKRSYKELKGIEDEADRRQAVKVDRIMEMIDYIEKDGTLKNMKWHILPYPENDEYYLLLIVSPKLPTDEYCAASLWKKNVHGSKKKFRIEIDYALLSIKDEFEHPDID